MVKKKKKNDTKPQKNIYEKYIFSDWLHTQVQADALGGIGFSPRQAPVGGVRNIYLLFDVQLACQRLD